MTEGSNGQPGQIITFYSFKGGTGRTMALANVAWILAANGKRVLVADWDLESPGLHRFYHPFIREDIRNVRGIIDMIRGFYRGAQRESAAEPAGDDADRAARDVRMREHVRDSARVERYAFSLDWQFPEGGTLDFLSAGLQNNDYVATLGAMDWDTFVAKFNGAAFLDELRADMKRRYDYVLIDSRTGLSDIANVCTVQLPDVLVDCFTLSIQGLEGGAQIARRTQDLYRRRNIRVLPVPTRLDSAEKEKLDAGCALAMRRFENLPAGLNDQERREYWAGVRIPYQAFYAFEETLAIFGDQPRTPSSLLAAFERLTGYITDGEVSMLPPMNEATRVMTMQRFIRRRPMELEEVVLDYVTEDEVWAEWLTTVLASAGVSVRDPRETEVTRANDEAREPTALVIVSPAYSDQNPAPIAARTVAIYVSDMPPLSRFAGSPSVSLARANEHEAKSMLSRLFDIPDNPVAETLPGALGAGVRYPGEVPKIFNPPARNAHFTGREVDLHRLRDELRARGSAVVLQPIALHGLGGVGKTQIALEYAYRYKSDYDLVWWVDCGQSQYVDASLVDLGWQIREVFDVGPTTGATGAEVARLVVRLLSKEDATDRWLLVFDNADELDAVERFLPTGTRQGHVLITSRNKEWERKARPCPIDVFNRAESVSHLLRRAQWLSEIEADQIAEAIGDLPLAVENAAALLDETHMPVEVYLRELEQRGPRTLSAGIYGGEQSVASTWDLSLDRLQQRSPVAYLLFEMCSVLAPDISLKLLYSSEMAAVLGRADPAIASEPMLVAQAVEEISRLALIKLDQKGRQAKVHRLVQAVVRSRMESDPEHAYAIRQDIQRVLAAARPRAEVDDPSTWDEYRAIWPHLETTGAISSPLPGVRQIVLDRMRYIWQRADFDGALEFAAQVQARWSQMDGAEVQAQLQRLLFLKANVLRSLGRFDESFRLDQAVLAQQRELLGDEHPHTLMTAGSLAADERGLGKYQDALDRDVVTHKKWAELLGDDHERTLSASNNLALSYRLNGMIEAAQDLDERTLNRRREVQGPEHPATMGSAVAVARDLFDMGHYGPAVDRMKAVYSTFVRLAGADSLEALGAQATLGVALRAAGRLGESEQALRAAVEGVEHRLGQDSSVALGFRLSHAITLLALNRTADGAAVCRDAATSYRRSLGQDHPHTLMCLTNLAGALRTEGDYDEALDLIGLAKARFEATRGPSHPYTLAAATVMAVLLADKGELSESRALDESTLAQLVQTLGPRHPDTLRCSANLLLTLAQVGEPELEANREKVMDDLVHVLGEGHPAVVAARANHRLLRVLDPQPF